jgi:hypothetical protein
VGYLGLRITVRGAALLAGLLGGLANVLVDIDHIPYWVYDIKAPAYLNIFGRAMEDGRFLHSAFFFFGLLGIACSGGLLVLLFLKSGQQSSD